TPSRAPCDLLLEAAGAQGRPRRPGSVRPERLEVAHIDLDRGEATSRVRGAPQSVRAGAADRAGICGSGVHAPSAATAGTAVAPASRARRPASSARATT